MFDDKKPLVTTRKRKNHLFIDINPSVFRVFSFLEQFFRWLDQTAGQLSSMAAITGIGIGLGIAWVVFGQPDLIRAGTSQHSTVETPIVQPAAVRLPVQNTSFIVGENGVQLQTTTALGDEKPIIIADLHLLPQLQVIKKLSLGDEIIVAGSNNGWYRYTVVETRVVASKNLPATLDRQQEYLVLQTPQNTLRTTVFVVFARPR